MVYKNIAGISVVRGFNKLAKFNVAQLQEERRRPVEVKKGGKEDVAAEAKKVESEVRDESKVEEKEVTTEEKSVEENKVEPTAEIKEGEVSTEASA